MLLILSTSKTVNASYRDAATGSVLYKVKTPVRVHDLTTTITRRIDDVPRHPEPGSPGAQDADERFGFLARIAWRLVGWHTTIQFGGHEIDPATFFRTERTAEYVFTAQDGKEYRWSVQSNSSRLKVNDAAATLVAEYRVKSVGLRTPKSDAMLEIFPEFEHLADEIMACISGAFHSPPDLSLDDFYPCRKDPEITSGRK
ncbi:hypothetical protein GGX14DRAFT_358997 [Mycena pura]|uniref:DUF6593 domain-containing protein n=1 Tax=Mycena pura TaxID=153505 RepID=A0AAD6YGU1_9AGAR|nr:hypothetical protein GGX14DRAFT_358997 [Mycena pura]